MGEGLRVLTQAMQIACYGPHHKVKTAVRQFLLYGVDSNIVFWNRFALECGQLAQILKGGAVG